MRFFNTTGPINPKDHYYVPHRLNEEVIRQLIQEKKYFILHAPRQSGKTTAMNILVNQLNAEGNYNALYINIEPAQAARGNINDGLFTVLNIIKTRANASFPNSPALSFFNSFDKSQISGNSFAECLEFFSQHFNKPFLLFIDEIDSLVGDTLISILRQLRAGYINRPEYFPQSVCLIGVRDVRDYRIWSEETHTMVLGGSAFNIKAESLVLHNFSLDQVRDLYLQHTQETGQQFTDEAINYAFYLTQGQPWLVNALAYQACFRDITNRSITITKEIINHAKEILIKRCDTHIDALIDRLNEPRVRSIIDAIISGTGQEENFKSDDLQYVRDLGLVTQQGIAIANPIYQEVIPRALSYTKQEAIIDKLIWYQNPDGSINMAKLLEGFTHYYRETSDAWLEKFMYKESGPHLLLQAYLQRLINGGGTIHREYALGRKRVDLCIVWHYIDTTQKKQTQRFVIETKVKRGEMALTKALKQTAEYVDLMNATEGHLVIFDRDASKTWNERIYHKKELINDILINVWGM